MDKGVLQDFVKSQRESQKQVQTLAMEFCRDLLKKQEGKRVVFCGEDDDPDGTDTPCTNFSHCCSCDDVVSANVKQVWLDDDNYILADLEYYYQQETEEGVCLENDDDFDWLELLDWLASM